MVAVFEHRKEPKLAPAPHGGNKALAAGAAAFVCLALGYLGWILPVPGGSIFLPTLIVAGVGVLVAFVGFLFGLHPNLRSLRVFCLMVVGVTVAASVWTYQFSIPASVAWDGKAVPEAQLALARVTALRDPLQYCSTIQQGSIGSIEAPYTECATSNPGFQLVTFVPGSYSAGSKMSSGLAYTDEKAPFPDECDRHLVGEWWMFAPVLPESPGECPIGYHFQEGP